MNYLKNNFIFLFLSLVLATLATYEWFAGSTILYYWDSLFVFNDSLVAKNYFSWGANFFPGASGNGWMWFIYLFSISIFKKLLGTFSNAQFVIYSSLIFISILFFYIFLNYLFENTLSVRGFKFKVISFFFAVFYALNLYTFYYSYFMFNPQIYIYAVLPLNMLALFKLFPVLKNEQSNQFLWLGIYFLSLFFMTSGFVTYVFLAQYLLIVLFYLIFYCAFSIKSIISKSILKPILFFVLVVISQWWWFYPSILGFKELYVVQTVMGTSIYFELNSKGSNLLNVFRLLGNPMMKNNPFSWFPYYWENLLFTFPLFIFPFSVIYLAIRMKKLNYNKIVIFFLTILLATLFVVKEANPPLAWISKYAFDNIPFFGAFRDAYHKSGLFFVFSYFILSGLGLGLLVKEHFGKSYKRFLSFFIILLVLGTIITGPFFLFSSDNIKKIDFSYNGKKYTLNAKTQIPPEYYQLKSAIEDKCQGSAVLVVPRAFTINSAVWEKYNTSYVGQDILSRLIDCSFISGMLSQNDPDSFDTAPYIMLQRSDYNSFKNFLYQNSIKFVLIRKDDVPYYFTTWHYSDPKKLNLYLLNDRDFKKTFENDYFSLYSLDQLDSSHGFSLASNIVYTDSPVSSPDQFDVLSRQNSASPFITINDEDLFKKYTSYINSFAPVADCVGCVKINLSSKIDDADVSLGRKIKNTIKSYLGILKKANYPPDISISRALVDLNDKLSLLMNALKDRDYESANKFMNDYSAKLVETGKLTKLFKSDFFSVNNKYMEARNFLLSQQNTLMIFLNSPAIENTQLKRDLFILSVLQESQLKELQKKIWETDFDKQLYRLRLNIPNSGSYVCNATGKDDDIKIETISLNGATVRANNTGEILLKKESYPVTVNYSTKNVLAISNIDQKKEEKMEIPLGQLKNGAYSIIFDIESLDSGRVILVVTKGKADLNNISTEGLNDKLISVNVVSIRGSAFNKVSKTFSINSLENDGYYLYILPFSTFESSEATSIRYKTLSISRLVENGDIQFYCTSKNSADLKQPATLKVKKIDPTKYEILVPKRYKGFLSFNQSYHSDWQAYSLASGSKHYYEHIKNTYANGWFIDDSGDGKIIVEFSRQNVVEKNAIISILIFLFLLFIYIRIIKNEKTL